MPTLLCEIETTLGVGSEDINGGDTNDPPTIVSIV